MPTKYVPWHQRESFSGASQEALSYIELEAQNVADRIIERHGGSDPHFIVLVMKALGKHADGRIPKAQPARENLFDGE